MGLVSQFQLDRTMTKISSVKSDFLRVPRIVRQWRKMDFSVLLRQNIPLCAITQGK